MITTHKNGDIFRLASDGLCHGVNTRGAMGGLAGEVARMFPDLSDLYRTMCSLNQVHAGEILPMCFNKFWIYNLVTQVEPGADARLDLIEESFTKMIAHAEENKVKKINVPQIGSGIGGLKWKDVLQVIEKVGTDTKVVLQLCIR